METLNIQCMRLAFDLDDMDGAIDAMYDVAESGLLYDAELDWLDEDWDYHSITDVYMVTNLDRDSFHIYAGSGYYTRCALVGWSDRRHTRQVNIIWSPMEDVSSLSVVIYAGIPCNTVERRIAEIIEDSISPFDV